MPKLTAFWGAAERVSTVIDLGTKAAEEKAKEAPPPKRGRSVPVGPPAHPASALPSIALQSAIVESEVAKERARCLGLVDDCIDDLARKASGSTVQWCEEHKIAQRMAEMRGLARAIGKLRRPGEPSEETDP